MPANAHPDDARNGRRQLAAALLAGGRTFAGAAAELGVNECTVRRWNRHPKFRARVRRLRSEASSRVLGMLWATAPTAVGKLIGLLDDPDSRVRLAAIRTVLDSARGLSEDTDLADKLDEFEAMLAERGQGGTAKGKKKPAGLAGEVGKAPAGEGGGTESPARG